MSEPGIAPLWPDDTHIGSAGGPMFQMADGKRYVITSSLVIERPNITQEARIAITRFIVETSGPGAIPVPITTYNIDEIISRSAIPTKEKASPTRSHVDHVSHDNPPMGHAGHDHFLIRRNSRPRLALRRSAS